MFIIAIIAYLQAIVIDGKGQDYCYLSPSAQQSVYHIACTDVY